MKQDHFDKYLNRYYSLEIEDFDKESGEIVTGKCVPRNRESKEGKIIAGIPRFCDENSYTNNWGLQWNIHKSTQLDSNSGLNITFN